MRQRLNKQIEFVMRRQPYKTTVAKYPREAGEKIAFRRRKDQFHGLNVSDRNKILYVSFCPELVTYLGSIIEGRGTFVINNIPVYIP